MFGSKEASELMEKLEEANKRIGELEKENEKLRDAENRIKKEFDNKEKQVVAMMEIQKKEAILEAKEKLQEEFASRLKEGMEENYEKLSDSLKKLHEEGNATTKYVQELSLKVIDRVTPTQNENVKQLSSPENVVDAE